MLHAGRRLCSIALLLAACATPRPAPPPAPPAPRPRKLLPSSSVAAVLAHRSELQLDDDQVSRLEELAGDLQRKRERLAAPVTRGPSSSDAPGAPDSAGAARPTEDQRGPGRPAPRGGHRGRGAKSHDTLAAPVDPENAWNEADTAAYLRAESLLRPEQRDRARDIAERFREDLYEQRAAQKRDASSRG